MLADTTPDMRVVREEIFGPVVTAMPFTDHEHVLPAANETNSAVAAGIWTRDVSHADRIGAELQAGTAWVSTYNIFDAALPFRRLQGVRVGM